MKTILTVAIALAVASTAVADHCDGYTSSLPEIDAAGLFYVDNDLCHSHEGPLDPVIEMVFGILDQNKCVFSIWVYEETNGIAGLQRGDEVVDDTCHGMIASDTIIF